MYRYNGEGGDEERGAPDMIRVGVIGVGYLGQHHARIYSELGRETGDIALTAVVDADKGRAEEIAQKYGGTAYADYRDMLGQVDALSIVTPTTMHHRIAMDCISAGKDLMIEKPITTTIEEAEEVIQASEQAGVIVQIGHLERFNPVMEALKPLLDHPTFLEAERVSPFLGRGTDVDITLDLMIHDIDIVLSLLEGNAVRSVTATGSRVLTGTIDFAKAWLGFEGGVHALFTASRVAADKSRRLTVFQKDSYMIVDYQNLEIKRFFKGDGKLLNETITVERKEPLKEELKDFVACIGARSRPRVCAIKGRNALKVALQIGEKIKQEWNLL